MRLLAADSPGQHLSGSVGIEQLRELYAWPDAGGVRTNFVSTLDGAATGADGLTGSINNAADKVVFDLCRALSDVVLVGAATADAEGYRPGSGSPLVAVSNRCLLPRAWGDAAPDGQAVLVTCDAADTERLAAARRQLGPDNVWVLGSEEVDLTAVVAKLRAAGKNRILCEGGPRVHAELLARGLVDELALTWVPRLEGGSHPRITDGPQLDVTLSLKVLLEQDGTLIGLWRTG